MSLTISCAWIRNQLQGYIVGNPITGSKFDKNFHVPYSHGVGIISDQLYEVTSNPYTQFEWGDTIA